MLYFFTDHPLFINNVGFWTFEKKFLANIDYINNVFWLINAVLDIVITLHDLGTIKKSLG